MLPPLLSPSMVTWLSVIVVLVSFANVGPSRFRPNDGNENITLSAAEIDNGLTASDPEVLFQSGMAGYAVFRLPAIVYHQGTFLAFCEGRMGIADSSVSEIVMKRGFLDSGRVTWDETITAVARVNETRLANPVPLVDTDTDTVFVLYNVLPPHVEKDTFLQQDRYNQTLLLIQSTDLGQTWSKPRSITGQTLGRIKPVPVFYAPGPGHGIQMRSGRLVIQGNFYYHDTDPSHIPYEYGTSDHSMVFLSDNHGKHWRPGGYVPYGEDDQGVPIHTSESTVVELADNTLCINSRTLEKRHPRSQSFSTDGGESFGEPALAETLIEPQNIGTVPPGCMASVLGFRSPHPINLTGPVLNSNSSKSQPWVLFSNPADKLLRLKISIRLSVDGCQTWSKPWIIWPLASGYSDMVQVKNTNDVDEGRHGPLFAILHERGVVDPTTTVSFMMFTLKDVINGIHAADSKTENTNSTYTNLIQ